MQLTPWKLRQRTFKMYAMSWNLHFRNYIEDHNPQKLPSGIYLMEVTSWNLHHGSYLVEVTPWKLPH